MSRQSRKRSSDDLDDADAPQAASETVLEALAGGRDPRKGARSLVRAQASALVDVTCSADGEGRGYILTEVKDLSDFFPTALTRDRKNNLLPDWEWVKLLPPDFYRILHVDTRSSGCFRAVPESKLSVDGYPTPSSKADDPDKAAGFANRESLRLLLYPNAFRFFWYELHEPLRAEGAWPTATQIMRRGFVLEPTVRAALGVKLSSAQGGGSWFDGFRAALRERYWPVSQSVPQVVDGAAAAEPSPDLLSLVKRITVPPAMIPPSWRAGDPHVKAYDAAWNGDQCWGDECTVDHEGDCMRKAQLIARNFPFDFYRKALFDAGHPELTAERIERLVSRLPDYWCDDCHCVSRMTPHEDHPQCACGIYMHPDAYVRGDLCAACGQDPRRSLAICAACGKAVDWRNDEFMQFTDRYFDPTLPLGDPYRDSPWVPPRNVREACMACHADGAILNLCDCNRCQTGREKEKAAALKRQRALRRAAARAEGDGVEQDHEGDESDESEQEETGAEVAD